MRHSLPRLTSRVRAFFHSDWEECAPLRWAGQLAIGAVPGMLIVFTLMRMAAQTPSAGSSGTAASIIPLLSTQGMADTPAFHRVKAVTSGAAMSVVQFRAPREAPPATAQRVLTVTKRTSPWRGNFQVPRQEWRHLTAGTRSDIDQGLRASKQWERVVLHGTGSSQGTSRLLERYHSDVQGVPEGMAWHFIIGNGRGSKDGGIEASEGWRRGVPAASGRDPGTRYTSISVCLAGDFQTRGPTDAQLEALKELLDYLGIKLGDLPLDGHEDSRGRMASCLGDKFPMEDIRSAWKDSVNATTPP